MKEWVEIHWSEAECIFSGRFWTAAVNNKNKLKSTHETKISCPLSWGKYSIVDGNGIQLNENNQILSQAIFREWSIWNGQGYLWGWKWDSYNKEHHHGIMDSYIWKTIFLRQGSFYINRTCCSQDFSWNKGNQRSCLTTAQSPCVSISS